ncbi:MAG: 2-amino-4-hydroxy-6-hydroxymethyldihydropteridine diphosphokinase [Planctomycetota bacterium]|jgi:dihydroneopterin aldolase/2-amino-4-hydroxy-6-hydroxymethyldihydropteridine diphosphokinase
MKSTAYLGLGSNLGDRQAQIERALDLLRETPGIWVMRTATVIETPPLGPQNQGPFLNTVTEIQTTLDALNLLDACQAIEHELGRERNEHWGPRTIDLDILLFDAEICGSQRLTLPHPEILNRTFVLAPLAELVPDLIIPGTQATVATYLERLEAR